MWKGPVTLSMTLFAAAALAAPLPEPLAVRKLQPFDYRGVQLDDGPLRASVDEVRQAYLGFANDDYLLGFRRRAGLPAPGKELGGWYSDDHFMPFGQVLSGLARLYAATGDNACRDKLNALLAGWAQCIEPDGFFFYSRQPNATHYAFDKMVCGLVDTLLYADNRDAATHLARITDWAERHLDRSKPYAYSGPGDPAEHGRPLRPRPKRLFPARRALRLPGLAHNPYRSPRREKPQVTRPVHQFSPLRGAARRRSVGCVHNKPSFRH